MALELHSWWTRLFAFMSLLCLSRRTKWQRCENVNSMLLHVSRFVVIGVTVYDQAVISMAIYDQGATSVAVTDQIVITMAIYDRGLKRGT